MIFLSNKQSFLQKLLNLFKGVFSKPSGKHIVAGCTKFIFIELLIDFKFWLLDDFLNC